MLAPVEDRTDDSENASEQKEIVGQYRSEVVALITTRRHRWMKRQREEAKEG